MIIPAPVLLRIRDLSVAWVPAILCVFGFWWFHPAYLEGHLIFWLGLAVLPWSLNSRPVIPFRLVITLLVTLSLITLLLPSTTGLYGILWVIMLISLAGYRRGISLYALMLGLIASPVFDYFTHLASFSMRLKLSQISAWVLSGLDSRIHSEGSLILTGDQEFYVDEACAGLYLLRYGLFFGTVLMSIFPARHPWLRVIFGYAGLIILILFGNIVRIMMLVLLDIPPENVMHEMTGILVYMVQILLPFYLILRHWSSSPEGSTSPDYPKSFRTRILLPFGFLILLGLTREIRTPESVTEMAGRNWVQGFKEEVLPGGIVKYYRESVLVYVKPPVAPYRSDHNPAVCWKGSGYTLDKTGQEKIDQVEINKGILRKGDDVLLSAWWFQSDAYVTGNEWEWRYRSLTMGEKYHLVNVTSTSEQELQHCIKQILGRLQHRESPERQMNTPSPVSYPRQVVSGDQWVE